MQGLRREVETLSSTSCSGVSAASELAAVRLQDSFLTSPGGAAGAVLAVAAELGGDVEGRTYFEVIQTLNS